MFFHGPAEKTLPGKTYHPVFKLKKANTHIHWSRRALFRCFESWSCTLHFPMNGSTIAACPTQLCCCLDHQSSSTSKSTCFVILASFVLQSKMRPFGSTAFLSSTTVLTTDGESPSLFLMSASFQHRYLEHLVNQQ